MKNCVSIECPFIHYCKDYNFLINWEDGCSTQKAILEAAKKLEKQKRKKGKQNE